MLEITGVERAYEGFALGPIDLTVDDEVLAVLGPSGCGKTTLLSIVAGLREPDAGTLSLDGRTLDGRPPEDRGTALVFQDGALFPHMTARENVAYAAAADADVDALAQRLAIADVLDQPADTLSGGEAQRVALARALAADPDALLLDEPLANLDAPITRQLRDDLRDLLASADLPVVYVTHDQAEASSVGDRVAVLRDGQVEQVGTPTAIYERPASRFVASFTGSANVFQVDVGEGGGLTWGSYNLDATVEGANPGASVWVSVRGETVEVVEDGVGSEEGVVAGEITARTFEGGTYRVVVQPDGTEATLEFIVLPPAYDRHRLAERDRVAVRIPAEAVHPIPD